MTRNDADDASIFDLDTDDTEDTELDEDTETPDEDTDFLFDDPEEGQEGEVTPEEVAAPAVPDRMDRFLDLMERNFPQQQPAPQVESAAWVDPFERAENKARLAELQAEAMYDPEKLEAYSAFREELFSERIEHKVAQGFAAQNAMQSNVAGLSRARDAVFAEVQGKYKFVDKAGFDEAVDEFVAEQFDGDTANFALALRDPKVGPKLKKALTQSAVAHAVDKRAGAQKPGKQKPAPAQPARRTAQKGAPARQPRYETEDVDYMTIAERAFYAKPKPKK